MEVFPSINQFKSNPASAALLDALTKQEDPLGLSGATLYYSFPLYREEEGGVVVADCVLLSPNHGVIPVALATESGGMSAATTRRCQDVVEQVPSYIQSRLIKNRALRSGPTRLAFEITPIVFAPFSTTTATLDAPVIRSAAELARFLNQQRTRGIPEGMFKELIATIEGAKGLIRPKKREVADRGPSSKGKQAELLEASIMLFDHQQKHGMMGQITGPQRIRGLAGSGKTVVLAMKAALTLLQNPGARIAYTFYTKSLYQHVKRLITRFYRQFDDRDPDWDKSIHILHGWGSSSTPGLYAVACERHGIPTISFQQASLRTAGDRFGYVCQAVLDQVRVKPIYDYIFVDEGQDFPLPFMRLCHALAHEGKFVLAYDDLQTIFQASTPSMTDIFGTDDAGKPLASFQEDIVLHKCYRNPREVLVSAHALGFGIYGERIVQMLESREHWEDVGYVVRKGAFVEGSEIIVERPPENSLSVISDANPPSEIVSVGVFESPEREVQAVAAGILADLKDGLQPEDILVVSVDDRYAKRYLNSVEAALGKEGVNCNNLHSDSFGIRDFSKDGRVTLSTVHKAKGNEAFMVYVVGADATMYTPDVRKRNMLFTAMTRAKGWVRVSGVGDGANRCLLEINEALKHFPQLVFRFPGPNELKLMQRDLAEASDRKLRTRRLLEQLKEELSDGEIAEALKELEGESRRSQRKKGWES